MDSIVCDWNQDFQVFCQVCIYHGLLELEELAAEKLALDKCQPQEMANNQALETD